MQQGNTATLVLLRHGESEWNASNQFTGWVDVDLTAKGRAEAVRRGGLMGGAQLVARRALHLAAASRDHHRAPGVGHHRPAVDSRPPQLAAQRTPLRRAAG